MKFVNKYLLIFSFIAFLFLNLVLYLFMDFFHAQIPFNRSSYIYESYHYKQDPRITHQPFSLLNALGQWDSQWYLKIAGEGYPKPTHGGNKNERLVNKLSYTFFPLLPLLIFFINLLFKNIELSAFILANSIMTANFFSLYIVISRWFSRTIAIKTIFLVFLFPFSIFFRGYYTEGLRLLLFIWLCFGIQEKKCFLAAFCLGLLSITSGISLLLLPYFMLLLFVFWKNKTISYKNLLYSGIVTGLPFFFWILFCFIQTGNPFFFVLTSYAWYRPAFPLLHNILLLFSLPWLPTISTYGSKLDVLFIWLTLFLTFVSRKILPWFVWLTTLILGFTSLILQDSAAFARFTSVLFPFFVYLAYVLRGKYYFFMLFLFTVGLLGVSLLFINWYWIE